MRHLLTSFLLLALTFTTLADGKGIYVVAFTTENKRDLAVENKAREELKKSNRTVASSLSEAEQVLVISSEYFTGPRGSIYNGIGIVSSVPILTQLAAVLVPVAAYSASRDDIDKLRESAVWQGSVSRAPFSRATVGKLIKQLIEAKKQ